jgi:hypothetical protein
MLGIVRFPVEEESPAAALTTARPAFNHERDCSRAELRTAAL